jgi:hypothetical protein
MERFLYRLANSKHANQFVLKGALLLHAWESGISRTTLDIDLAGKASNRLDSIRAAIADVCRVSTEPDGIEFDARTITATRIKEDAEYKGVRIRLRGSLAGARTPMQVDIGFGDAIVPGPVTIQYPALLEFPAPVIASYPRESVVAEKLEALTVLGLLNSRLKDYFDLWLLAQTSQFDGKTPASAIAATFQNRGTTVEVAPEGLTSAFSATPDKARQWRAFVLRGGSEHTPGDLADVVRAIREFAGPPLVMVADSAPFEHLWEPGGPWRKA